MIKPIKLAGMAAMMLASAGTMAVLAAPGVAQATNLECNATPTLEDFEAGYKPGSDTEAHIAYVGELPMCEGVTKTFSLNAYLTEGDTWADSGKQTLVDHQSVVMSAGKTEADLKVVLPEGDCYFQTDLYPSGRRYDGVDGALPSYPDSDTPDDAIDARMGGSVACEGGQGGGDPTPTPSVLGEEAPTTLPETGAGLTGMVALSAGMLTAAAGYIRARRTR